MAAVFDATSNPTTAGTSDLSWTHTLGNLGATGLITVVVEVENSSNNITGATFNGVAMTLVVTDGAAGTGGNFTNLYELHGANVPAAGNYTVTATFSAFDGSQNSRAAGAMSFGGIKAQVAEATASVNGNATSPLAVNITTVTPNALVVAGYGNQNGTVPSFSTGEIDKFDAIPASGEQSIATGAYKTVVAPGATSTSLTVSNPEAEALVLASFAIALDVSGDFAYFI